MSPVRWLRAFAILGATVMLWASSCTWPLGTPVTRGVPPPRGAPVPPVDTHAKGRPAGQLHAWAVKHAPAMKIPVTALEAYAYAARVAEVENPNCHLSWTTLAGIGQVESHHGTHHHATVAPNGDVRPPIRAVGHTGISGPLSAVVRIVDNDADGVDGHAEADRGDIAGGAGSEMGPMQFVPETWRLYGVDANNDGVADVDNIDDAALSAAGYLCWRGKDLATARGWITALLAYNNSGPYARTVRDWATAYAAGHPL